MIELYILLAETDRVEAELLEKDISANLDQPIDGVKITVNIVTTLAEVREFAPKSNVILIDLILDDAGPEEVMAAIPELPEPVIVITDIIDPLVHAKCKLAGAFVLIKSCPRNSKIYTIIHCLGKSETNRLAIPAIVDVKELVCNGEVYTGVLHSVSEPTS